nr:retrotransposon protein, putative, unclassified [Tanacetum cinerariifolium]
MRPFGCPVTILNTLDHLGQVGKEKIPNQEYILLSLLNTSLDVPSSHEEVESLPKDDAGKKSSAEPTCVEGSKTNDLGSLDHQMKSTYDLENTNINAARSSFSPPAALDDFSKMPNFKDIEISDDAYDDRDEGAEANYNNLETMEPKKVTPTLDDERWVEAMQEELLQIKLLNVWTLVDLPHGKRAIRTKWSAFLYGTIKDEVYVSQPSSFVDPKFPDRVYKVEKALYGLHQAPKAWSLSTEFEQLMHNRFQMSSMGELTFFLGLQQLLDYGYNFMHTKIHMDNESAICVVKNPVYHSNTKHIEIRHHFIRDSYKKRLIEMVKIHTDYNVVDLLTKAFDVTRF